MIRNRWVRVGLVAVAILLINALARLISAMTLDEATLPPDGVAPIAVIGAGTVVVLMAVAGAWWAVRYPFQRLFFDLGAASVVGALLALLLGPFAGGDVPFDEGLGTFIGEFLQFIGLAALGTFLGFAAMIVAGKDWRTRGLRQYEQVHRKRPHRIR